MITKFLDIKLIKTPTVKCNAVCAFTGVLINQGVLKKDLISKTFTDHDLLRYDSLYVGVPTAMLLSNVIDNGKGIMNSLRNYSFYADRIGYRILKREDILNILENVPTTPFQICITFSNKKHIAYRSKPQYNSNNIVVTTDIGDIIFNRVTHLRIINILKSWYTIINSTAQQPTNFTKAEILGETKPKHTKIKQYGVQRYLLEDKILQEYRNTKILKLLVHILNKTNA